MRGTAATRSTRPAEPGRTAVRTECAIIVTRPMRLERRAIGVLPCSARGSSQAVQTYTRAAFVRTRLERVPAYRSTTEAKPGFRPPATGPGSLRGCDLPSGCHRAGDGGRAKRELALGVVGD